MAAEWRTLAEALRASALDLAWSLWAECGVSTWHPRHHASWIVELEPLLAFTAQLGGDDPRLFREVVDWCVQSERLVSVKQFRHVVAAERWPFKGEIATFGATVGLHSKRRWPGVAGEAPRPVSLSGKSTAPDLRRPSLLQLRLRALFGTTARAEIIRALLFLPRGASVKQISEQVAYTRRQVALDLDMLLAGGLLKRAQWSSPATYSLVDPEPLVRLVGPMAEHAPRWAPIFRVLTGLLATVPSLEPLTAPEVELGRQLRLLEPSFERGGLFPPTTSGNRHTVEALQWAVEAFASLATGDPSPLAHDAAGGHGWQGPGLRPAT